MLVSSSEIAETLVLLTATSQTHVARVATKRGARDRAQLVVAAYESGLVTPGENPRQIDRPDPRLGIEELVGELPWLGSHTAGGTAGP